MVAHVPVSGQHVLAGVEVQALVNRGFVHAAQHKDGGWALSQPVALARGPPSAHR